MKTQTEKIKNFITALPNQTPRSHHYNSMSGSALIAIQGIAGIVILVVIVVCVFRLVSKPQSKTSGASGVSAPASVATKPAADGEAIAKSGKAPKV
jgi:uncharacterized membrane protein